MFRDPLNFATDMARTFGDFVKLPLPLVDFYLVSNPDDVAFVLKTGREHFIKDWFTRQLRTITGNGLVVSEGEFWKRQRRLAQPAFHRRRIEAYADTMVAEAAKMTATWRNGTQRDVHADMMHITLGIVSRTLFGADVASDAEQVGHAIDVIMEAFMGLAGTGLRFPLHWPTPGNRRFAKAMRLIDDIIYRIIEQRTASDVDDTRVDLLSMLLAAVDEIGGRMSREQLRDEAVTMFLAGHETTALALTFALFLLSENPAAEARLHAELDAVLGDGPATLEHAASLPFCEAVIKEAMRLYPPVAGVGREAIDDFHIAGYPIAKGSQIFVAQWVMHRDSRWFENPLSFAPERWLDGLEDHLPKFCYQPFGGGPRACIGNRFAMLEAVLVLATVARDFRLRHLHELDLVTSITVRPRAGVNMRLQHRRRA